MSAMALIPPRSPSPGFSDGNSPPLTPSTTSTLISTPQLKPMATAPSGRPIKFTPPPLDLGDQFSGMPNPGKNLQPHVSNLPRRKRAPPKPVQAQGPLTSSTSTGAQNPDSTTSTVLDMAGEPEALPPHGIRENLDEPAASAPPVQVRPTFERVDPNPPLSNLPRRRRKPLTAAQKSIQRAYRRCLQEIGEGSGVFVAYTDVDDEEEQSSPKLRSLGGVGFSVVVRVCAAERVRRTESTADDEEADEVEGSWHGPYWQEDERTLRLYVSEDESSDDGCTQLHEEQLRYTCRFLQRASSQSNKILITTPRDRAADGMSLALLYLAYSRRFVPPPVAFETPSSAAMSSYMLTRGLSSASITSAMSQETSSRIHALLIHLHDESCDDLEEAYGHVLAAAARPSTSDLVSGWEMGSGLRMEWRGVLSHEGVDCLDEVLEALLADSQ
ncbi:hypothetical protein HGRIS_001825 [Hohenbuehelia grisea]|uniref:Uncharacterized protein n=1 Tax=Hohenbuehelia grisea TaxID=104357 RepID=A0ABR3JIK9_9AGAR